MIKIQLQKGKFKLPRWVWRDVNGVTNENLALNSIHLGFWTFLKCWFLFPAALVCRGRVLPAASPRRRQHLCAASGLSVAAVGAAGLSHHTLFPLLLVVSLFHRPPVPVSCIASSTLHVSCQLCFAAVSLLGSQNHTSSNQLSFCSRSVSCHTRSLSLLTLLLVCCPWRFYITFIHKICCPS